MYKQLPEQVGRLEKRGPLPSYDEPDKYVPLVRASLSPEEEAACKTSTPK
jgi:hypothetical protein